MTTIEVKIKRISETETNLPLPRYITPFSSGLDVFADIKESIIIEPRKRALIPTGFALEIPQGYEAQVRPRSGLALKKGITVLNSPGTIDADYRGEVKIILINHGEYPVEIQRADRIAQLVFVRVEYVKFVTTTQLSSTNRSDGGFGHSGN